MKNIKHGNSPVDSDPRRGESIDSLIKRILILELLLSKMSEQQQNNNFDRIMKEYSLLSELIEVKKKERLFQLENEKNTLAEVNSILEKAAGVLSKEGSKQNDLDNPLIEESESENEIENEIENEAKNQTNVKGGKMSLIEKFRVARRGLKMALETVLVSPVGAIRSFALIPVQTVIGEAGENDNTPGNNLSEQLESDVKKESESIPRKQKAKPELWTFLSSKSEKIKISDNPKVFVNATVVEPLMQNFNSIWTRISGSLCSVGSRRSEPNNRGNRFRVMTQAYEEDKKAELKAEKQQPRISCVFYEILLKVASQNNLNRNQVLAIIETAKVRGGIYNAANDLGEYLSEKDLETKPLNLITDGSGNFISKVTAQKFSADFQKECQACGIYSGRQGGKSVGLRLTFIPDDVVLRVKENSSERFEDYKANFVKAEELYLSGEIKKSVLSANFKAFYGKSR